MVSNKRVYTLNENQTRTYTILESHRFTYIHQGLHPTGIWIFFQHVLTILIFLCILVLFYKAPGGPLCQKIKDLHRIRAQNMAITVFIKCRRTCLWWCCIVLIIYPCSINFLGCFEEPFLYVRHNRYTIYDTTKENPPTVKRF